MSDRIKVGHDTVSVQRARNGDPILLLIEHPGGLGTTTVSWTPSRAADVFAAGLRLLSAGAPKTGGEE